MTLNDIRIHLQQGGIVREIMENGDQHDWNMGGGNISIDAAIKNFGFRSAAGISIFRIIPARMRIEHSE